MSNATQRKPVTPLLERGVDTRAVVSTCQRLRAQGASLSESKRHIFAMFGVDVSTSTISNMARGVYDYHGRQTDAIPDRLLAEEAKLKAQDAAKIAKLPWRCCLAINTGPTCCQCGRERAAMGEAGR